MSLAMLDTTVLSNFAHVQRPDLVERALLGAAATSPAVAHELCVGQSLAYVPTCDWRWLSILEPTADEQQLAVTMRHQLDAGEAECLAVAVARGYRFLSDDRVARQVAEHHGVAVSGTLGVLVKLVNNSFLTIEDADRLLSLMITKGYRSPVDSLLTLFNG